MANYLEFVGMTVFGALGLSSMMFLPIGTFRTVVKIVAIILVLGVGVAGLIGTAAAVERSRHK